MNLARVLENMQVTPTAVAPRTPRQITQITPLKMMQDILKSPATTRENRGEKLKELWTKWIQREIKDCIDNEEAEIRHAGRGSFPSPLVTLSDGFCRFDGTGILVSPDHDGVRRGGVDPPPSHTRGI